MSPWIGVHGINQHYDGRRQILQRWVPALADGLEWATQRRIEPDLDVAYYGRLFRVDGPGKAGKGVVPADAEAQLAELDEAELADLTAVVEEMVTPEDLTAATGSRGKAPSRLPVPVLTLIGAVERRFPRVSGALVMLTLRQVRSYLRDPELKAEVDQITASAAAGATVLIGHSLGSVVAYEFLRQHPGHSVQLLLTLGSPLGLKLVRDGLPGGKPGVARWVNVRDPHDPVTAAGALDRWYPAVVDGYADNGPDAHDAEHYLSAKATGEALRDFLPEVGQ